jgi:prophage antirepressor-like protein
MKNLLTQNPHSLYSESLKTSNTAFAPSMRFFYALLGDENRKYIEYRSKLLFEAFSESPAYSFLGGLLRKIKQMTNEIITFNFKNNSVRTQAIDGNAWFCLVDACSALGLSNSRKTKTQLQQAGVTKSYVSHASGSKSVTFINEPNLYRLIFRSNKPQAQAFADWVYEEVLPSIRKTGAYIADKPVTVSEHTRSLPSGKKEIVLSEKAKQEIGGIVKACLGTSGKTSCALDVDVLKNLIREVLREELAGFLLKDGVTATEPFNGNVTADGLPAANWALSIVHGASALQYIIGQLTDKQKEAVKLLA